MLGLGSTLYLSLSACLCLCICLFVSLRLGLCHHQMISFQKIYGLYGLKHHTVEINENVTLEHIHTYRQTDIHVNIELEFCEKLTEFAICVTHNTSQDGFFCFHFTRHCFASLMSSTLTDFHSCDNKFDRKY